MSWDYICQVCGKPAEYPRKLYCNKCRRKVPNKRTVSQLKKAGEEEEKRELETRFNDYKKGYYNRTEEGTERTRQGHKAYWQREMEKRRQDPEWVAHKQERLKYNLERILQWKIHEKANRPIKQCENCGRNHKRPGLYCSCGCANARRIWSALSRAKLRIHIRRLWMNKFSRKVPGFRKRTPFQLRPKYIPKPEDYEVRIPTIMDRSTIADTFEGWDIGENW